VKRLSSVCVCGCDDTVILAFLAEIPVQDF